MRKFEVIEAEIWGHRFRKKTYTGKRFIAVAQAEDWPNPDIAAFKKAEKAEAWGFWMRDNYGCLAHGWAQASVVTEDA